MSAHKSAGDSDPDAAGADGDAVLFFRESPYGEPTLVFAPPERALLIDRLHRAISESKTWGEFRARMPPEEYARLYEESFSTDPEVLAEDEDAREPGDLDKFSSDNVPGYSDGDYPPWIAKEQDAYLPEEVLASFGTRQSSVVNGSFWTIAASKRDEVIVALTELGYKPVERQDLEFF